MKKAELKRIVTGMGILAVLTHSNSGVIDSALHCLTQSTSKATDALVNQYGVNGREFVIDADEVTAPPVRLDSIAVNETKYVFDAVMPLYEDGTGALIGFRAYAKGK